MKLKVYRLCWILAYGLLLGGVNNVVAEEAPSYQNPAQAAHAANLSEAALASANEEVTKANDAVTNAEANLEAAEAGEIELSVEDAQAALDEAIKAQEDAAGRAMGLEDGTLVGELRAAGMGWGEIAHELGVHPSVLGLGHTKAHGFKSGVSSVSKVDEIAVSTSMNLNTGKAKGHGKASAGKSGGSGASSSKGNGNKGNKGGNENGGGNKGGNGNGNGNGGGKSK